MRRKDLMLVIATLFFCFFVILRTSGPKSLPKLGKHPYLPPVDRQPAGPAVPPEPERPYEPVDVEQPPYKPPLSDPPVNVLRPQVPLPPRPPSPPAPAPPRPPTVVPSQARQVAEMGEKEAFDPFSLVAAKGIDAVPIGTNNAWNQDPAPGKTTYKCYRSVDWAEVCVYTNICHDGNFVVFFNDTKPAMSNITRYVPTMPSLCMYVCCGPGHCRMSMELWVCVGLLGLCVCLNV